MQLHDLRCGGCGVVQEDVWLKPRTPLPLCSRCRISLERYYGKPPHLVLFKSYVEENLDHQSVRIESRRQLKEEAAKRGLTIDGALI